MEKEYYLAWNYTVLHCWILIEYLSHNFSENREFNTQNYQILTEKQASCRRESELKMTLHSPVLRYTISTISQIQLVLDFIISIHFMLPLLSLRMQAECQVLLDNRDIGLGIIFIYSVLSYQIQPILCFSCIISAIIQEYFTKALRYYFLSLWQYCLFIKKRWGCWGKEIKKDKPKSNRKLHNWENPKYLSLQTMMRVSWGKTNTWVSVLIVITAEIKLQIVQSHLNEKRVIQRGKTDVHLVLQCYKKSIFWIPRL